MVAVARVYNDRDPGQLWLYRAAPPARADGTPGSAWRAISNVRQGIDPRRMAQVDLHRIAARDGRELPVWVTLPAGHQPRTGSPAVVLLHGGPWVRGGYWRWSELEQFLASRGYVVISPEFRGSTGYGQAHYQAGFRQWGQAMQDDVADATKWAQAQGLADRFCVAGASYGGYSTLMGLVRDPELYRCGVAIVAVTDPFLYLQGSWWIDDDISGYGRRYSLPRLVGDPERDAAMLKAASPLEQAARITRPLLLMHGGRDLRVPVQHAERLREALRAAGREPEWVVYPDEGHGFLRLDNRVDMARRIEAFLGRHLAP
jgi:dipeptidyl aminopeptidase/acylaminoacyl peptidase